MLLERFCPRALPRRHPFGSSVALFNALLLAWLVLRPAPHALYCELANAGVGLGPLAASLGALRLMRRVETGARRRAGVCLALSTLCYGAGQSIYVFYEIAQRRLLPFPSWADAIFLSSYPLLLWGVLLFPQTPLPPAQRLRVLLDGLMTMTALLVFGWYFLLGPTWLAAKSTLAARLVGMAYPCGDLVLLFCLLALSLRGGRVDGRTVGLTAAGMLCVVLVDIRFCCDTLHGIDTTVHITDIGWPFGYMLLAQAAVRVARTPAAAAPSAPRAPALWPSLLPFALVPATAGLLVFALRRSEDDALQPGLWAGGALLFVLVLVRQGVALRENAALNRSLSEAVTRLESLSLTDGLTGLLNHRALHQRLAEAGDRTARDGSSVAVAMLDLDSFKFFNDAYGHAAGDEVLLSVAAALCAGRRPGEQLARFGGDEFAVLLPAAPGLTADAAADALESRLSSLTYCPPGAVPIPLGVSVGVALFPDDAPTPRGAQEVADARLRAKKRGEASGDIARLCERLSDSSEGFVMLNALVTAVDTKDRYTRRHSEDVLTYSLEIARALGLDARACHDLEVAALLHDVGKIGVPDHILRKPGWLSGAEFAAIRQHPTMGAAIVSAVPGFGATLAAVRHHHERWDGGGYPDGLPGESIPLAARVMAVADAYSAMTTDRPYRKGMGPDAARRLLAEGAGTQWDPACVRAFLAARAGCGASGGYDAAPLQRAA